MYIYIYIYSVYIYIHIIHDQFRVVPRSRADGVDAKRKQTWVIIKGGCSRRGVQWMGVVLHSKLVHSTMQITTPCFHYTPLCGM